MDYSIGETRWWSKHGALSKVFGYFNNPEDGLFVVLLKKLLEIKSNWFYGWVMQV